MTTTGTDIHGAATQVLNDTPVVVAYLFGSRARGDARPDSDVDVAVLLEQGVDPKGFLESSMRLASRLERLIGHPVDPFLTLDTAPLRLVGRVLRDGVLLYCLDDARRVDFETRMGPMALDYEIKAAELDRQLLADHSAGRR